MKGSPRWTRRNRPPSAVRVIDIRRNVVRGIGIRRSGGLVIQASPQMSALGSEEADLIVLSIISDEHVARHDSSQDGRRVFVLENSQTVRTCMSRMLFSYQLLYISKRGFLCTFAYIIWTTDV